VSDELRFAFTLDPAEQVQASQLLSQRSLAGRLSRYSVLPFLILPLFAAFVLRWPRSILWPFIVLLAIGIVTIIFSAAIQRWRAKRVLMQYPQLRDLTYRLADDGLHISTAVTEARIAWPMVSEALETDKLFLLFAGPKLAYYIPKRVVGDSSSKLRSHLHSWLGSRADGIGLASVRQSPNER
jgi:hypothetical protein